MCLQSAKLAEWMDLLLGVETLGAQGIVCQLEVLISPHRGEGR